MPPLKCLLSEDSGKCLQKHGWKVSVYARSQRIQQKWKKLFKDNYIPIADKFIVRMYKRGVLNTPFMPDYKKAAMYF